MGNRALQADLILKAVGGGKGEERRQLWEQRITAAKRAQRIYAMAFDRWKTATAHCDSAEKTIRGRMVSGLGQDSVLEAGIALHHTYATPLIRGSALKGLSASFSHHVWGNTDPEFRKDGKNYQVLFGDTVNAGFVTFHDAWILPSSLTEPNRGLVHDVMTPHHGPYYMSGDDTAPTDFDDPNPVSFLSVAGEFRFVVECADSSEAGSKWRGLALTLLTQALATWGVGAKTNAGYGRFD